MFHLILIIIDLHCMFDIFLLDLNLMFKDKSGNQINEQLESDELDNFIQELDKEDDFDPILLVQNFNN